MKDKKTYIMLVVSILFTVIGVSLAYFGITIVGNDVAKSNKVVTGNLELTFNDSNELTLDGAFPGDYITKTISVKNTGTKEVSYNLVWTELTNEIINNELVIEGTCKNISSSNTEDGTCSSISQKAVSSASNITSNIPIKPGYTHEYTVKIIFIDTGKPQNYNKNKTFEGKLGLTESSAKTIYCTYDGELTQGAEYVNGQYTYRYMQEDEGNNNWKNITTDGCGVILTNKTSTDDVISELCTYINNKPIVSMKNMFLDSESTLIDMSSFNTNNIISMHGMFSGSYASALDFENFNTSNVHDMSYMFQYTDFVDLDLNSFNTSNVTNMSNMFSNSQLTQLDLNSFDTSNVIDMSEMFSESKIVVLDLSNFDTRKVTNFNSIFAKSVDLKTIYAGNDFKINSSTFVSMFSYNLNLIGGAGTKFDYNYPTDKTYAHIDGGTSNPGYFTDIADKPVEPYSFSTDSWSTIANGVKNNNISKYNVGDTKRVNLGTYGTHTVRIANTSTPNECSTEGFSQTACGFVLEFADVITEHKMNDTMTNVGGWPATSMRTFVNDDVYNLLPYILKSRIIDTTVVSSHGDTSGEENFTSTDKLYLLAPKEIYTNFSSSYDTAKDLTRTLDYYTNIGVTTSDYSGAIKKNGTSAYMWWLREANSSSNYSFHYVSSGGRYGSTDANNTYGVAPAFRIG